MLHSWCEGETAARVVTFADLARRQSPAQESPKEVNDALAPVKEHVAAALSKEDEPE